MLSLDLVHADCSADDAGVVYKVAANAGEREAAFRLLYSSYLQAGLVPSNPYEMRVTPYNLLSSTAVFVAKYGDEAICTASLVGDGELGLPMQAIYAEEIVRLRDQGAVLAEVSGLADRRQSMERFFPVFLRLVRVLCPYARRQGIDNLVVAVHPRHARFYQRFLRFERIGEERSYPQVCDRPAVALLLDFARLESRWPDVHDLLFGGRLSPEDLQPRPMSESERARLRAVVGHCEGDHAAVYAVAGAGQASDLGRRAD